MQHCLFKQELDKQIPNMDFDFFSLPKQCIKYPCFSETVSTRKSILTKPSSSGENERQS